MIFLLKHFNTPLLKFSAENGAESNTKLLWVSEADRSLLPLDLAEATSTGVDSWLRHRTIPRNRAYVDTILSSLGLSINRPLDVIHVSKGLSLNDCYWVVEENDRSTFEEVNLYDNHFSRVLGQIAFTGYGSSGSVISSSPEFTTNGMLPKCWRRNAGLISLFKGGTSGASNTGFEPYSEFYATQIAQALEFSAVPYRLARWKGLLCSVCDLFTSKELSYVPVGRIVRSGGMKAVRNYYESLGPDFLDALNDMIVFDAIIYNTDRHYGNFGFLVDSRSNCILAPAPLFDHGNSLFNLAGKDALANENALRKYAKTLLPCVYDDYLQEARAVLSHRHRDALRKLVDFRFKRHSRYNLPPKRLALLEKLLHQRVQELL